MKQHISKNQLLENWQKIKTNIEKTRLDSPVSAPKINFVAVSKQQSQEIIVPLLEAGHRLFAENKVQEALEKWPALRGLYADLQLHLIGSLQSNKAKEALTLFDSIETIDRTSLIDAIAKEIHKQPEIRCKQFMIQVNTGEELQKGGVLPEALPHLIEYSKQKSLPISGLMCIPPHDAVAAPHFALLHQLAHQYNLNNLSMGMSGDYETAIRMGSTHVRIGTALFGERSISE